MRSRSVACVAIVAAIASTSTTGCRKKHRPEPMTRVWLGKNGAFGLLKKGGLASWGEGTQGLLGDGTTTSRALPKLAFTDDLPHELAVGDAHACGIFDGDRVTCWGAGDRGQRGDGGVRASVVTSPKDAAYVTLADGSPLLATRVVARADRTCAVAKGTNALFCWGAGRATPFELPVFRGASADLVALSDEDVCAALISPREVRCTPTSTWENVDAVADPVAPNDRASRFTAYLPNVAIASLVAGASHVCVLTKSGRMQCWGKNDRGQLGDGTTTDAREPVTVVGIDDVTDIAAGDRFTCARTARTVVACWGDNEAYQLVDGTTTPRAIPAPIPGLSDVASVVAAGRSACVRPADGLVRCWGGNASGQLGDGSRDDHSVPMPVKW